MQGRGAAVGRSWWALGRVSLGALEVGWCGAAWLKSQLGYRGLLTGTLAGPLACPDLIGLAAVGGRYPLLSPSG